MTAENEVISGVCEASEAEIDMSSCEDHVKVSPDVNGTKVETVNLIGNDNVNHDPDVSSVGDTSDSDKNSPDCNGTKLESVNLIGNDNVNPDISCVGDSSDSDKKNNGEVVFVQSSFPDETVSVSVSTEKNGLNGTNDDQVESALASLPDETVSVSMSTEKNDLNGINDDQVESALATFVEPNSEEPMLDSTRKNAGDTQGEKIINNGEFGQSLAVDKHSPLLLSAEKDVSLCATINGEVDDLESTGKVDDFEANKHQDGTEEQEIEVKDEPGLKEAPETCDKDPNFNMNSSADSYPKKEKLVAPCKNFVDSQGLDNNGEIGMAEHPSVLLSAEKDACLYATINGEVNDLETDEEVKHHNGIEEQEEQENGQLDYKMEVKGVKQAPETCDRDSNFNRNPSLYSYSEKEKSVASSSSVIQFATYDGGKHLDEATDNKEHVNLSLDTDVNIKGAHDSLDTEMKEADSEDSPESASDPLDLDTKMKEAVSEDSRESASDPQFSTQGFGDLEESVLQKNLDSQLKEDDVNAFESPSETVSHIQGIAELEKSFQPLMSVDSIPPNNLDLESIEDVNVTVELASEDIEVGNLCKNVVENNGISVSDGAGNDGTENYKEGHVVTPKSAYPTDSPKNQDEDLQLNGKFESTEGVRHDSGDVQVGSSDVVNSAIKDPNIMCGTVSSITGIEFGSFRPLEVFPLEQNTEKKFNHSVQTQVVQDKNIPLSKRFQYLIKIPRFNDERLQNEVTDAQLLLEEKTHERDNIQTEVKEKRNNCQVLYKKFKDAKSEERAARELVKLKRQEIDSVQVMNNRLQNVISITEVESQIFHAEKTIQHQSHLSLKEEKELIRKIRLYKSQRHELSSNIGSKDEVREALDQRDHIDELLKGLKKELFGLKNKVSEAEAAATLLKQKYDAEDKKLEELNAQFRNANHSREGVYKHISALRKEFREKSKYFGRYKDAANAANDFAFNGDKESLYKLCTNQVESMMELWNNSAEFRKDYIRCNMRSTLRRLKTLDGRSLGPDEEAIVFPTGRVGKQVSNVATSPSPVSLIDQPKLVSGDGNDKSAEVERKYQSLKRETSATPIVRNGPEIEAKNLEEVKNLEDDQQTEQELEMARKVETLKRKEMEEKLKEQRRLEEKAKAQEALERKKRNAEKAQRRVEIRAQKEAEQKEKDREKRQRKNERKKSMAVDAERGITNGEIASALELPAQPDTEREIKESPTTSVKRSQKSFIAKQTKTKVVPPPLRNKGKRKWKQPLVWTLWISLVLVLLFITFGGEGGVFGGRNSQDSSRI